MGQALRRATSRVRSTNLDTSSSSSSQVVKNIPPKVVPKVEPKTISKSIEDEADALDHDGISQINPDNVLEDKDPGYDAMLSQMVGRIKTKPGGKLEMGEAFVVEKYNRPMPKLRNTKPDSSYDEKPVPAGTLNVAKLRQMLLLHQGKDKDHDGPMGVHQIAESFRIDIMQVQKILQYVSLPLEASSSEQKTNDAK